MIDTDASDCAISTVFLQNASLEASLLLSVAFYSKKLDTAEKKYPVHDYKILAII